MGRADIPHNGGEGAIGWRLNINQEQFASVRALSAGAAQGGVNESSSPEFFAVGGSRCRDARNLVHR
jgi:hypothetical protein